ncbi:MAG: hypothetical protein ACLQQ4_05020 [Bacteroidia bacterium]|jgi:hypothetical protein
MLKEEKQSSEHNKKFSPYWRTVIEVSFIIFLFYSNLLMGEFSYSGAGRKHDLFWALQDILTRENFLIAIISGLLGHLVFGFLRRKF